jgi:glycosyltransferase involved in cell wall biosynthesis
MESKTICVCTPQVPFIRGGNEYFVETLCEKLNEYGHNATLVRLPFKWYPRTSFLKSIAMWRLADLSEYDGNPVDAVICTKFPSYVLPHHHKLVWMTHQHRAAYDLFGHRYGFPDNLAGRFDRAITRWVDNKTLVEARHIFTISGNVSQRLLTYNSIQSEVLYPPIKNEEKYHCEDYRDYIFTVSRLTQLKRIDTLIEAMRHVKSDARCLIAGSGPLLGDFEALVRDYGLEERVRLLGAVSEEELWRLYANCFAVYFAPFDEDYGLVTIEAFKSKKPVITLPDSGGVLEFVEDGVNGFVAENPRAVAERIDYLFENRDLCKRMGKSGYKKVEPVNWKNCIKRLNREL